MIKFNDLDVTDVRIGESLVNKVAVGSEIVWQRSTSPLPSGYTQVKYLESSGKQYISTGKTIAYINSANVTFTLNFAMTDVTRTQIIFGAGSGSGNEKQLPFISSNKKFRADYTTGYGVYYLTTPEVDVIYTFEQTATAGILNNESKQITYRVNNDIIFTLFGKNRTAGIEIGSLARCKIFNFIVYENESLIQNFIPCLDTNNTPCFYDTVSQQTFYNQGTGTFGYETMDGTVVAPT